MNKKQQKWIAVLVTLTFVWLMQVSTMPVAAAGATAQASVEQGPDYYEAAGQKAAPAKKKSILPFVLIGVGVVAVAVLVLMVSKTKYDITGTWDFIFTTGVDHEFFTISFRGTRSSGDFSFLSAPAYFGSYTVNGKNVSMALPNYPTVQFNGAFTDKDTMSGTWVNVGINTTWTATRVK